MDSMEKVLLDMVSRSWRGIWVTWSTYVLNSVCKLCSERSKPEFDRFKAQIGELVNALEGA